VYKIKIYDKEDMEELKHHVAFTVRIPSRLMAIIENSARKLGVSRGEIIRRILYKGLAAGALRFEDETVKQYVEFLDIMSEEELKTSIVKEAKKKVKELKETMTEITTHIDEHGIDEYIIIEMQKVIKIYERLPPIIKKELKVFFRLMVETAKEKGYNPTDIFFGVKNENSGSRKDV